MSTLTLCGITVVIVLDQAPVMNLGQSTQSLPVVGKALRVAPGRSGVPTASFWKFWVSGNEIYATTRQGDPTHLSLHASGQIHLRLRGKDQQLLSPPLPLADGSWLHAFELKFLLGRDAFLPKPTNDRKKAFLIDVPADLMLVLNLLTGRSADNSVVLPAEFLPGGQAIWRSQLTDSRPVVLVARVMEMAANDRRQLDFIRRDLIPKANFKTPPTEPPYLEIRHVHWHPQDGNVILIVPMGAEAVRSQTGNTNAAHDNFTGDERAFNVVSPSASIPIVAPDGATVAELKLAGTEFSMSVSKDVPTTVSLGTIVIPKTRRHSLG